MTRTPVTPNWQRAATGLRRLRDLSIVAPLVVVPVVALVFIASKRAGSIVALIAAAGLLWFQFSAMVRWRTLPLPGLAKWAATGAWMGAILSFGALALALVVALAETPPGVQTALKWAGVIAGGLMASGLLVSLFMVGLHFRQLGVILGVLLYAAFMGFGAVSMAGGVQGVADGLRVAFPLFLLQLILYGHALDVLTGDSPTTVGASSVQAPAPNGS